MEKIHHCSFSLFMLEKVIGVRVQNCFEFIKTFDNLEDAKIAQKEIKRKSIILPSY